jgi:hypothetical protein
MLETFLVYHFEMQRVLWGFYCGITLTQVNLVVKYARIDSPL